MNTTKPPSVIARSPRDEAIQPRPYDPGLLTWGFFGQGCISLAHVCSSSAESILVRARFRNLVEARSNSHAVVAFQRLHQNSAFDGLGSGGRNQSS
jgi:hypothetical protein